MAHEQCCSASWLPPFVAIQAKTNSARGAVGESPLSAARADCTKSALHSANSKPTWPAMDLIPSLKIGLPCGGAYCPTDKRSATLARQRACPWPIHGGGLAWPENPVESQKPQRGSQLYCF